MSDTLYGEANEFGMDSTDDPMPAGYDREMPALSQHAAMAGMLIGPVISDEGMRDGIRDAAAAALGDAGIIAVTLHLPGRVASPDGTPTRRTITLEPSELVEVFLSRLGAEFGFSIPGYLTLEETISD